MSNIWKTFFIYLPFIIVLMIFYWSINEVEVEYPTISINDDEILYDTDYKYKTTLIPFIYNFTKDGRSSNYTSLEQASLIRKYDSSKGVTLSISKMEYDIDTMYILHEGEELKNVYSGKYNSDITKYLSEPGIYRISLYCKLHRTLYYDGYVDYKFKIEVL